MVSVDTIVSLLTLETAPLWLIWLVVTAGLMIAHEIGYLFRRFSAKRRPDGGETSDSIGHRLPAALALLGLLIAFTFSMAADRFATRRALVVSEGNAIGTTYLRLQLL